MAKKYGDELLKQFHSRLSRAFTTALRANKLDGKLWKIKSHAKAHEFVKDSETGRQVAKRVVNAGRVTIEHLTAEQPKARASRNEQPEGIWWGVEERVPYNVTLAKASEVIAAQFAKFGA